tara:strand:+ start:1784 stop:2488 length:705 start_codon:yes stop_codon:yes gene_type:complete
MGIKSFSIIIPILNEKKNINILFESIKKNCSDYSYEIILVDDNSKDGSNEVLKKIKNRSKRFEYIIRKNKKNDLCKSISLGITKTKFDNILIMDGDLQHDPKYLPTIMNIYAKKNPDFLVCVRDFKRNVGLSNLRSFSSKFLIFIINILFGKIVSDPMSGFFIFKKKIFFKFKNKMYGKGFKFLFDILYQKKTKFRICEYKIVFKNRKKHLSKMNKTVLYHLIISIIKKIFNSF